MGEDSSAQTSHIFPRDSPSPVGQISFGKEGEAPNPLVELLNRKRQPFKQATASLSNHNNPEFPSQTSNEIHQRRHRKLMQFLSSNGHDGPATTEELPTDAQTHLNSSWRFGNAQRRNQDMTGQQQSAEFASLAEDGDVVMTDDRSRPPPNHQQDDPMDESPDLDPDSAITNITESSADSTAAPFPVSIPQQSSIAEDVPTTTTSIEAQRPGGRFWTPAEYKVAVAGREDKKCWDEIAEKLPGRTAEDCRRCIEEPKSRGMLGDGSHPHWTEEEENILGDLKRQGKEWSEIAQALPARSPNGCQSRWRQKFEQKKEKKPAWWQLEHETRQRQAEEHLRERERER